MASHKINHFTIFNSLSIVSRLVTLYRTHTRAGHLRTCHVTLTSVGLGGQWAVARLASGQSSSS